METTLGREIKSTVATRMFENPSLPLIPTTSKRPSAQIFISRSITRYLYRINDRARARHVKNGHSRLWFLGQYVLELALTEFFLQRYPRESPGPMRERVFALIGKRYLPKWIKAASLQNLIFPYDDMDKLIRKER